MSLSFNGKVRIIKAQGAAACLPGSSAKAGQPPKSKIDGWEAIAP